VEDHVGRPAEGGGAPGRVRRRRPRDPAVDAAILSAAVDLLGEIGYARLTMDQVAARAGAGKASLYLRWPNKVALVAEAIRQRSGAVPEVPNTGSLREDMLLFLRALLRSWSAARQALAAVSGEVASNPELQEAWRRGLAGALLAGLRTIVTRAVERGELPATSDIELLSMLPLTLLQNWRLVYEWRPDEEVVARIVDQFYTPATSCAPAHQATGDDR
jgi:AcrR family transcriptional regulator